MSDVNETLEERQLMYGDYRDVASLAQQLKEQVRARDGWRNLSFSQRESLDMIFNKIARVINGNPHIGDHWHDVAGYAKLVENQIELNDSSDKVLNIDEGRFKV